jgi:hypothetical protein
LVLSRGVEPRRHRFQRWMQPLHLQRMEEEGMNRTPRLSAAFGFKPNWAPCPASSM